MVYSQIDQTVMELGKKHAIDSIYGVFIPQLLIINFLTIAGLIGRNDDDKPRILGIPRVQTKQRSHLNQHEMNF